MNGIRFEKRTDGVAVLTFDAPSSPVNVISANLFAEFRSLLEKVLGDPEIKACVLASAKKDFIAGADLKWVLGIDDPAKAEAFSSDGKKLLDLIERGGKPFVAAISGQALGGGLEVAMACRGRIAADDPSTVLALPEVNLGLLPGGGGTQRAVRLAGLPAALPLMLTGKRLRAKKALRMGLVDAVTSPGGIVETAAQAALALAEGKPLGRKRKKPALVKFLESALGRGIVFRKARQGIMAKTRGLYPAPLYILDCVRTGMSRGAKAGYERESELFGRLVAGPGTKNLIRLFLGMTELKKDASGVEPEPVKRLAVLGGGFMGAGIASVSLGLAQVAVKDISDQALGACGRQVWEGLAAQMKSGAIGSFERDRLWARFAPTTRYEDLAKADLVIEAIFEDLALKRRVLAETEAVVSEHAVFASNTSALPISWIAQDAARPERVLGMHYFSPVHRMPLLEMIVTDKTAPWALAKAREFGVRQGKTVIVVRDGPGFYTTRILSPFLNEAMVLLEEGARIEDIDRAMKNFGYPVGPIALLDEVGIDVGAHVSQEFGGLYAERGMQSSPALPKLFAAGYMGRKNKKGFYRYDGGRGRGGKKVNQEVYGFFGGSSRKAFAAEEIADRLSLLMVNEAVWCLQEKVIACPRDGDVGSILGLGFPPFRGGVFRYLDALGAAEAVKRMTALAGRHGERFRPAPLLEEHAASGQSFCRL